MVLNENRSFSELIETDYFRVATVLITAWSTTVHQSFVKKINSASLLFINMRFAGFLLLTAIDRERNVSKFYFLLFLEPTIRNCLFANWNARMCLLRKSSKSPISWSKPTRLLINKAQPHKQCRQKASRINQNLPCLFAPFSVNLFRRAKKFAVFNWQTIGAPFWRPLFRSKKHLESPREITPFWSLQLDRFMNWSQLYWTVLTKQYGFLPRIATS